MRAFHYSLVSISFFRRFLLQCKYRTSMTKRPHSPGAALPPKRSRKPSGFRIARPPPTSSQPSTLSNSSLFVTVSQPDDRRGTVITQPRIIASTSSPSTTTSTSSANVSKPEIVTESTAEFGPTPEPPAVKPKRKRKTKNTVFIRLISGAYWILTYSSGSSQGMAEIPEYILG